MKKSLAFILSLLAIMIVLIGCTVETPQPDDNTGGTVTPPVVVPDPDPAPEPEPEPEEPQYETGTLTAEEEELFISHTSEYLADLQIEEEKPQALVTKSYIKGQILALANVTMGDSIVSSDELTYGGVVDNVQESDFPSQFFFNGLFTMDKEEYEAINYYVDVTLDENESIAEFKYSSGKVTKSGVELDAAGYEALNSKLLAFFNNMNSEGITTKAYFHVGYGEAVSGNYTATIEQISYLPDASSDELLIHKGTTKTGLTFTDEPTIKIEGQYVLEEVPNSYGGSTESKVTATIDRIIFNNKIINNYSEQVKLLAEQVIGCVE